MRFFLVVFTFILNQLLLIPTTVRVDAASIVSKYRHIEFRKNGGRQKGLFKIQDCFSFKTILSKDGERLSGSEKSSTDIQEITESTQDKAASVRSESRSSLEVTTKMYRAPLSETTSISVTPPVVSQAGGKNDAMIFLRSKGDMNIPMIPQSTRLKRDVPNNNRDGTLTPGGNRKIVIELQPALDNGREERLRMGTMLGKKGARIISPQDISPLDISTGGNQGRFLGLDYDYDPFYNMVPEMDYMVPRLQVPTNVGKYGKRVRAGRRGALMGFKVGANPAIYEKSNPPYTAKADQESDHEVSAVYDDYYPIYSDDYYAETPSGARFDTDGTEYFDESVNPKPNRNVQRRIPLRRPFRFGFYRKNAGRTFLRSLEQKNDSVEENADTLQDKVTHDKDVPKENSTDDIHAPGGGEGLALINKILSMLVSAQNVTISKGTVNRTKDAGVAVENDSNSTVTVTKHVTKAKRSAGAFMQVNSGQGKIVHLPRDDVGGDIRKQEDGSKSKMKVKRSIAPQQFKGRELRRKTRYSYGTSHDIQDARMQRLADSERVDAAMIEAKIQKDKKKREKMMITDKNEFALLMPETRQHLLGDPSVIKTSKHLNRKEKQKKTEKKKKKFFLMKRDRMHGENGAYAEKNMDRRNTRDSVREARRGKIYGSSDENVKAPYGRRARRDQSFGNRDMVMDRQETSNDLRHRPARTGETIFHLVTEKTPKEGFHKKLDFLPERKQFPVVHPGDLIPSPSKKMGFQKSLRIDHPALGGYYPKPPQKKLVGDTPSKRHADTTMEGNGERMEGLEDEEEEDDEEGRDIDDLLNSPSVQMFRKKRVMPWQNHRPRYVNVDLPEVFFTFIEDKEKSLPRKRFQKLKRRHSIDRNNRLGRNEETFIDDSMVKRQDIWSPAGDILEDYFEDGLVGDDKTISKDATNFEPGGFETKRAVEEGDGSKSMIEGDPGLVELFGDDADEGQGMIEADSSGNGSGLKRRQTSVNNMNDVDTYDRMNDYEEREPDPENAFVQRDADGDLIENDNKGSNVVSDIEGNDVESDVEGRDVENDIEGSDEESDIEGSDVENDVVGSDEESDVEGVDGNDMEGSVVESETYGTYMQSDIDSPVNQRDTDGNIKEMELDSNAGTSLDQSEVNKENQKSDITSDENLLSYSTEDIGEKESDSLISENVPLGLGDEGIPIEGKATIVERDIDMPGVDIGDVLDPEQQEAVISEEPSESLIEDDDIGIDLGLNGEALDLVSEDQPQVNAAVDYGSMLVDSMVPENVMFESEITETVHDGKGGLLVPESAQLESEFQESLIGDHLDRTQDLTMEYDYDLERQLEEASQKRTSESAMEAALKRRQALNGPDEDVDKDSEKDVEDLEEISQEDLEKRQRELRDDMIANQMREFGHIEGNGEEEITEKLIAPDEFDSIENLEKNNEPFDDPFKDNLLGGRPDILQDLGTVDRHIRESQIFRQELKKKLDAIDHVDDVSSPFDDSDDEIPQTAVSKGESNALVISDEDDLRLMSEINDRLFRNGKRNAEQMDPLLQENDARVIAVVIDDQDGGTIQVGRDDGETFGTEGVNVDEKRETDGNLDGLELGLESVEFVDVPGGIAEAIDDEDENAMNENIRQDKRSAEMGQTKDEMLNYEEKRSVDGGENIMEYQNEYGLDNGFEGDFDHKKFEKKRNTKNIVAANSFDEEVYKKKTQSKKRDMGEPSDYKKQLFKAMYNDRQKLNKIENKILAKGRGRKRSSELDNVFGVLPFMKEESVNDIRDMVMPDTEVEGLDKSLLADIMTRVNKLKNFRRDNVEESELSDILSDRREKRVSDQWGKGRTAQEFYTDADRNGEKEDSLIKDSGGSVRRGAKKRIRDINKGLTGKQIRDTEKDMVSKLKEGDALDEKSMLHDLSGWNADPIEERRHKLGDPSLKTRQMQRLSVEGMEGVRKRGAQSGNTNHLVDFNENVDELFKDDDDEEGTFVASSNDETKKKRNTDSGGGEDFQTRVGRQAPAGLGRQAPAGSLLLPLKRGIKDKLKMLHDQKVQKTKILSMAKLEDSTNLRDKVRDLTQIAKDMHPIDMGMEDTVEEEEDLGLSSDIRGLHGGVLHDDKEVVMNYDEDNAEFVDRRSSHDMDLSDQGDEGDKMQQLTDLGDESLMNDRYLYDDDLSEAVDADVVDPVT